MIMYLYVDFEFILEGSSESVGFCLVTVYLVHLSYTSLSLTELYLVYSPLSFFFKWGSANNFRSLKLCSFFLIHLFPFYCPGLHRFYYSALRQSSASFPSFCHPQSALKPLQQVLQMVSQMIEILSWWKQQCGRPRFDPRSEDPEGEPGNPLKFLPENSMFRWFGVATVCGVRRSRTWLKDCARTW